MTEQTANQLTMTNVTQDQSALDIQRIIATEREKIVGTLQQWLAGEPVWSHDEILDRWGREFLMYRCAWEMGHLEKMPIERRVALIELRHELRRSFGFTLPCRELLEKLEQHQPIVEIGAGTGFLTALMRQHGIDVIGTDAGLGRYRGGFQIGLHDPVQMPLGGKTAVRRYRDRTVFCSWPSLHHSWFRQALRAMRIGQRAIIIESHEAAEKTTWDYRDACFTKEAEIVLPAWPDSNDRAATWIKKRHMSMRFPTLEQATAAREKSHDKANPCGSVLARWGVFPP
jgi:hypothetical protein